MLRRSRRVYFWALFTGSLVAILAGLFFISGYRIDVEGRRISTTGSLFIKSEPKKAEIAINGKPYKKTTPVLINNLAPRKYNIRVGCPDRFGWEKTLEVDPQKTTIIDEIILFKKDTEPRPADTDYERGEIISYFTPVAIKEQYDDFRFPEYQAKDRVLFYNDHEIWVWDQEEEAKSLIVRLGSRINEAIWHPSGSYVIYTDDDHVRIAEFDGTDYRNSYDLLDYGVRDLRIDGSGENLYFKRQGEDWKLNIL